MQRVTLLDVIAVRRSKCVVPAGTAIKALLDLGDVRSARLFVRFTTVHVHYNGLARPALGA
jgi:hypothetical protein